MTSWEHYKSSWFTSGILLIILIYLVIQFVIPAGKHIETFDDLNYYYGTVKFLYQGGDISQVYHLNFSPDYVLSTHFRYAPIWLVLFYPLAFLSYKTLCFLWMFLASLCVVLILKLSVQIFKKYEIHISPIYFILPVAMILDPLKDHMKMGQVDLYLNSLVLLFFLCYIHKKTLLSNLLLALAVSLKPPAATFFLIFLFHKDIRSIFITTLLGIFINLGACFLLSPSYNINLIPDWLSFFHEAAKDNFFFINNHSFLATLGRFLKGDELGINFLSLSKNSVLIVFFSLQILTISILYGIHRYTVNHKKDLFIFGILIVFSVIFAPVSWKQAYAMLFFPLLLMIVFVTHMIKNINFTSVASIVLLIFAHALTHKKILRLIGLTSYQGSIDVKTVFTIWPLFGFALLLFLLYGSFHYLKQNDT